MTNFTKKQKPESAGTDLDPYSSGVCYEDYMTAKNSMRPNT